MIIEVYDIEVLSNLFTYTGFDAKKKEWYQFVICEWRNDTDLLYNHLFRDKICQVGFNNEGFDYPVLHHFINHYGEYKTMSGQEVAQKLYNKSQEIIGQEFSVISDKNKYIKQLDLFRIWHYNNKARATSLKDLEIAMRMKNVEEMPIHHTHWCKEGDEIQILSYNKNDVEATYNFLLTTLGKTEYSLYKGKNKIELRQKIKAKFGIPCLNYPDVKIGEQLILNLYCNKTGNNLYDITKRGGTNRSKIALKDCIPKWANFETKEFNSIKKEFQNTVISNIKGEFSKSLIFHDTKLDYGTGGLHSCIKSGIYNADDYWTIIDEDIGSLYPSIAIQLGIYPEHLGNQFLEIYDDDIVSVRLSEKRKPKKERDMVIMEGYKLAANGIYGKSGEETSPLYDPLYTMKTTVGGQMFLSLWTEKLVKAIPEIKFIQHNTDGITYLCPRKDVNKVKEIGKEMTSLTGLYIEDNVYSKFVVRDVNNYLAVYESGDIKYKGCFEIDKEYHKDPSMRIVPISLKRYYIDNIPIEQTIRNHTDIFDFCLRLKTNSKSTPYFKYLENGKIISKKLDRTTRYYVSNSGGIITKQFDESRISGVNVGYSVTLFNKYVEKPMNEYNINYNFYIAEANKIKNAVYDGQLTLF